jgi:hypothetical protein
MTLNLVYYELTLFFRKKEEDQALKDKKDNEKRESEI